MMILDSDYLNTTVSRRMILDSDYLHTTVSRMMILDSDYLHTTVQEETFSISVQWYCDQATPPKIPY
jgi:hypothetical protein